MEMNTFMLKTSIFNDTIDPRFLRENDCFLKVVSGSTIKKSKEFLRNGYLVLRIGRLYYNIEQLTPQKTINIMIL